MDKKISKIESTTHKNESKRVQHNHLIHLKSAKRKNRDRNEFVLFETNQSVNGLKIEKTVQFPSKKTPQSKQLVQITEINIQMFELCAVNFSLKSPRYPYLFGYEMQYLLMWNKEKLNAINNIVKKGSVVLPSVICVWRAYIVVFRSKTHLWNQRNKMHLTWFMARTAFRCWWSIFLYSNHFQVVKYPKIIAFKVVRSLVFECVREKEIDRRSAVLKRLLSN